MKKVIFSLFILLVCIIGVSTVKADTAYDLFIDESNNLVVKNSEDDSVIDDYSNIVSYDGSTLTLKEGLYYDYIEIKHSLTVTTNNKKVYVEFFKAEGTATDHLKIDFNKANIKGYRDGVESHGWVQFYLYRVYGEFNDSTIDLLDDYEKKTDFWAASYINGKGYKFINSTIKVEKRMYLQSYDTVFKDSNIYTGSFEFIEGGSGSTFENIDFSYLGLFQVYNPGGDYSQDRVHKFSNATIIDRAEKGSSGAFSLFGKPIFEDCTIEVNSPVLRVSGDVVYKNCNIDSYGNMYGETLTIDNCEVKAGDEIDGAYGLTIKDSNIFVRNRVGAVNPYFCSFTSIEITNSIIDSDGGMFTNSANGYLSVHNSKVMVKSIEAQKSATFKDSIVYVKDTKSGRPTGYYSAIDIIGELNIVNSRMIIEELDNSTAISARGGIHLDNDNGVFIYRDKSILDVNKYISNTGTSVMSGSREFLCNDDFCMLKDIETYTTYFNGAPSKYAETYGYYNVKVKIVNGTIDSKTEKDFSVLLDEEFIYPTNMKANTGYEGGAWSKTGDNEYTYTFNKIPKNPKTGIINTIGLLELSVIAFVLFICNKDKLSIFKRI